MMRTSIRRKSKNIIIAKDICREIDFFLLKALFLFLFGAIILSLALNVMIMRQERTEQLRLHNAEMRRHGM